MKIAIVGTGYVGLVTGTCLAETGHEVICADIDRDKIQRLKRGECPLYEPGLEELVKRNVEEERLSFTIDLREAVENSLVIFITVSTPQCEDGSADLRAVLDVAENVGKVMNGYKVIVDKSTVPVGTAKQVRQVIAKHTEHEFDVVSNPEFLKEGAAVDDFMKPDRIIIGTDGVRVTEIMKELYSPFVRTGKPILLMDIASAELTKYAANAMLATRISFMNELANLCEVLGADVDQVREGLGTDVRIGNSFLFPGVGYGGSCFPKDVRAIVSSAANAGYDFKILKAVDTVNESQKNILLTKVARHFGSDLSGKVMAVWGLSFKPKTDDMREAPSKVIIEGLLRMGATVKAHDPVAMEQAHKIFGDRIKYCTKNYDAVEGADALLLVTEWLEFRRPDFERLGRVMRSRVIFDGRNIYNPKTIAKSGFVYYGVGRRSVQPNSASRGAKSEV